MQHQGLFKKIKKIKGAQSYKPKSLYRIGWPCCDVGICFFLVPGILMGSVLGPLECYWEIRHDKEGWSLYVKDRKGHRFLLILCSSSDAQDQKELGPNKDTE